MTQAEENAALHPAGVGGDGLSDHPLAVYPPPPGLDQALAALPLVGTAANAPPRIGYLTNYSFHIWYQILIEIITRRAGQYGAQVLVRDAKLSVERQLEQAREVLTQVDALIMTPAATAGLEPVVEMCAERGIPLVLEANPIHGEAGLAGVAGVAGVAGIGAPLLVAICDYDAGYALGQWVGRNLGKAGDGSPRVLDLGLPTLRPCRLRSEGFLNGLQSILPEAVPVARLNGGGSRLIARRLAAGVFARHPEIDLIFAMDDETGQGALEGYHEAGLDPARPERLTLAVFGLAGDADKDLLMAGGVLKAAAAMFPEYVAVRCVDGVMRAHRGDRLPRRDVIPSIPVTAETLPQYYPRIEGAWAPDLRAIAALPAVRSCTQE